MLKVLTCILLVGCSRLVEGYKYETEQLKTFITKSLGCLENQEILTPNATFQTGLAYSLIVHIVDHDENLSIEDTKFSKNVKSRLEKLIGKSYDTYTDEVFRDLWWSGYYGQRANYFFSKGKITKVPALQETLSEIVGHSVEYSQCTVDLVKNNPRHDGLRTCVSDCFEEMSNTDYDYEIPVYARLFFAGFNMVNNCSTYTYDGYGEIVDHYCSYTFEELKVMLKYRKTQEFLNVFYYFLDRVVFCTNFGISEIVTPDVIGAILDFTDCKGCMKYSNNEDVQVTTALALTTFISYYRYTVQQQ